MASTTMEQKALHNKHLGMAMIEVSDEDDGPILLSIRRMSENFGMARETVRRRIEEVGLTPAGSRNGFAVYRLREAAQALFGPVQVVDPQDPDTLPPGLRNLWYQSENRRMDVDRRESQLMPSDSFHDGISSFAREIDDFAATLPEILDAECSLTPEQSQAMHSSIASYRNRLKPLLQAESGSAQTQ